MEMPGAHPRWGIEFDWLAVDRQQQVAVFTSSGHGGVPEAVLRNVPLVDDAMKMVEQLPTTGTATKVFVPDSGDYSYSLGMSAQGFFTYEWTLWHGPYERLACPTIPMLLKHLPPPVREAAELVDLALDFCHLPVIAVPYVELE
jgi:hypothetical protein